MDYKNFLEFDYPEQEAKERAKEATKGIIEAIKWLDDVTGVLLVMDSNRGPLTQVNITIIGNLGGKEDTIHHSRQQDRPSRFIG